MPSPKPPSTTTNVNSRLCLVAVSLLTIFAPGFYFREMGGWHRKTDAEKAPATTDGLVSEGGATE